MGIGAFAGSIGNSLLGGLKDTANLATGNIPKAILCVPDVKKTQGLSVDQMITLSDKLREQLLIGGGEGVMASFKSLAGRGTTQTIEQFRYLALEVPYNPSSIYLETVAGNQMSFSGGAMGDASTSQLRQNVEPVSTTMSVQLLFDAVNVYDSFMMSNLSVNVGNAVGVVSNAVNKLAGDGYSVKPQMDGIMSLLTRDYTRHVLFFWAQMCFQGELTSVSSNYKMFNTQGHPVRGEIRLTIRQSEDVSAKYSNKYWEKAFTKAFGDSMTSGLTQSVNSLSRGLSNSVLNLNI
ncbi:MAG: hypothetical protein J6C00_01605 [Eubacterium sp.]|nr:hypothetical protein [Eubacterium sp.]MDD7641540.1 hypothetical protein [bacterium]MDY4098732.1 hypothetical protein [Lachnospiraceae bacterium]